MTKFYIEYNPYLVETVYKKDGIVLNENNRIGSKKHIRIQVLLSPGINWLGLAEEIAAECNDNTVSLTFKGRKIDFDDIQYCIKAYSGDTKFELSFDETRNDNNIIEELDSIFDEIKKSNISQFHESSKNGQSIFDRYEEVKQGVFDISVIATMSSGKSTLINALLGTELLPSQNEACTAAITRISDNDQLSEYYATAYKDNSGTIAAPKQKVTLAVMEELNKRNDVSIIDIEGNIPGIPSSRVRLRLVDTPGPNNAMDANHRRLTNSIIKNTRGIILYVMNIDNLGTDDDETLLRSVSEEMKKQGKQSRDRFIFVLNKCDRIQDAEKGTLKQMINHTRSNLQKFQIEDPTIIPTSAALALVIRRYLSGVSRTAFGVPGSTEKSLFNNRTDYVEADYLHFDEQASLTPTVRKKLLDKVEEYHKDEENWDYEALIHSGIPALEETIIEYIEKYAYPIMINDCIEDIKAILDELDMQSKFKERISSDEDYLQRVKRQVDEAKERRDASLNVMKEYRDRINAFSLSDDDSERRALRDVEKFKERIFRKYDHKKAIGKEEAEKLITEFQEQLDKYYRQKEEELGNHIYDCVYMKGKQMLDEYTQQVRSLLQSVDIDGYDFERIAVFRKFKINNVEQLVNQNQKRVYKTVKEKKFNTKWLIPLYGLFFEDFYTYENHQVFDRNVVDVSQIVVDEFTNFEIEIIRNIGVLYDQARQQIEEYKQTFNSNLDELLMVINRTIQEIAKTLKEQEATDKRVKRDIEVAEWADSIEKRLRSVLA